MAKNNLFEIETYSATEDGVEWQGVIVWLCLGENKQMPLRCALYENFGFSHADIARADGITWLNNNYENWDYWRY